jgi:hypothetical protein
MIAIDKATGFCAFCHLKNAVKAINGVKVCTACGDNVLIKIIGKCSKEVMEAIVTFKVMPRGVYERAKESISKTGDRAVLPRTRSKK